MMRSLLKCVTIVILVTLAGLTNGENDTDDSVIIENDDNDDVEEEIVALPEDKGIVKAIIQVGQCTIFHSEVVGPNKMSYF